MLQPLRNINLLHINKDINMKNLQTIKRSVQKGFTLIELMIVVAIIGILAAIAIPAYTDYTIKSRVSEGASLVGAAKTAVEVYWSENGSQYGPENATDPLIAADLNLCDTAADAACTTWVTTAEYVSSITLISSTPATPWLEVNYKTSNALGDASATCVIYFPSFNQGQNIRWQVRAEAEYVTPGSGTILAATCTDAANGATPNKYKPKV